MYGYPKQSELDADSLYDAMVWRIDQGKECPDCHMTHRIQSTTACGMPLFICHSCNTAWFDFVTRPSMEAA